MAKIDWAFAGNLESSGVLLDELYKAKFSLPKLVLYNNLDCARKNKPIKDFCEGHSVPLYFTSNGIEFTKQLSEVDFLFLHRFRIIPREVFTSPKLGAYNLHQSLLPKYRGVHPISWALVNGESNTGVTIHKIDEGIDTGDIFIQKSCEILDTDDIWSLTSKLDSLAVSATLMFFDHLRKYNEPPVAQKQISHKQLFYARRRKPEDGKVTWSEMKTKNIYNLVRALCSPMPNAFVETSSGRIIYIKYSELVLENIRGSFSVGEVIRSIDKSYYIIKTVDACIKVQLSEVLSKEEFLL